MIFVRPRLRTFFVNKIFLFDEKLFNGDSDGGQGRQLI